MLRRAGQGASHRFRAACIIPTPLCEQEETIVMTDVNRLKSADAVNEEQRKIARDMDDVKQEEETIAETPKQRQIADMIDRAERTQEMTARPDAHRVSKP
jgi:uncharacterized Zn finger protein (UPF0148 family)